MPQKIIWYKVYDYVRHSQNPQQAMTVRTVDIDGIKVSLCFDGTTYFALADRCPHAGARFGAGGWCEAGLLVCPVHRYKYDLKTGKGLQGDFIPTYEVAQKTDGVYIGIPKQVKWWWPF